MKSSSVRLAVYLLVCLSACVSFYCHIFVTVSHFTITKDQDNVSHALCCSLIVLLDLFECLSLTNTD